MPNYSYRCAEGHEFDSVVPVGTSKRTCSCGRKATKQSIYAINQQFPAVRHEGRDFIEATELMEDKYTTHERREGVEVERPNLWSMAKQEAAKAAASMGTAP